jgi:hypothetical protein
MKEAWLMAGAVVPVDVETTSELVAEIKRLIDVVGGMALAQQEPDWKAEYLKSVESGCITLDELREANAELAATNRQVEILSDALAESRREVDAMIALVRADEREACAKVCENEWSTLAESKYGEECADAIRARGNT